MRAVRLAEPVGRRRRFFRSAPAWGAGVFAMLLMAVFFNLPQTVPVSQVTPEVVAQTEPQSQTNPQSQTDPLMALGESLLVFSEETAAPEQALRNELERLKSDFARFDFRS